MLLLASALVPLADLPVVVHQDESSLVATWRSLIFPVWGHRAATVKGVEAQVRACENHGKFVGKGKLLEIVYFDEKVRIPDSSVRHVLEAGVKRVGPYYACVASVYEGTGFLASVVRGVITSLGLLSPTPFPQKVFASRRDCVTWTSAFARREGMQLAGEEEMGEALQHVVAVAREAGVLNS